MTRSITSSRSPVRSLTVRYGTSSEVASALADSPHWTGLRALDLSESTFPAEDAETASPVATAWLPGSEAASTTAADKPAIVATRRDRDEPYPRDMKLPPVTPASSASP